MANLKSFNFKLPNIFRYTDEHPYVSPGLSRETKKDNEYTGFKADVAEFNDKYMCDMHYTPTAVNKMGLGIDEIVASTINFSRKNYADYFPDKPFPEDVKLVGNTIKSKKMPEYIAKFLEKGVRLLLQGKGQEFIEEYYAYVDKIYNFRIPLKQIATKGKVKKSIEEYLVDCNTLTKAGTKKSRQAWMELAIKNGMNVDMGETLYYVNTGKKKSETDVKRETHFYKNDGLFNEKIDVKKQIEKEWKLSPKGKLATGENALSLIEYTQKYHPEITLEDEIILNCQLLPREVIESETDVMCNENIEYNVTKYLEMFNKRITPLLVCFSRDIRNKILVNDPADRAYFTAEESKLVSGQPNKEGDQDTYEQLMTMEDKEIRFWKSHPEWEIPFLEECDMNWEAIVADYDARMDREKQLGIDAVRERFEAAIKKMDSEKWEDFIENGDIPDSILKIVDIDGPTGNFIDKNYPDIVIATIYDVFDMRDEEANKVEYVMQ